MSKRTVFTTVTPLPAGITRETVMETLRSAEEMIDLNPLVEERHPIKPPPTATAEEFHCQWYSLTDRVQYLPGGLMSGKVTYNACFHDLATGVQTHVYAPLGLNIKGKWTLGGSLPGEPIAPVELGVGTPLTGLWLREDVDMRCNFMMTSFVKGTLKKAHGTLVARLLVKAQIAEVSLNNQKISDQSSTPAGTDYSPASQYSYQSFQDNQTSPVYQTTPPQYNDKSSHAGNPHSQDEKYPDSSLQPKPLSIRNSGSTFASSAAGGSQVGRSSYQDPPSTQNMSWQSPNGGPRSPPTQQAQLSQRYTPNICKPSPSQGYNPADYQHRSQESGQITQSGRPTPAALMAGPPPPPPKSNQAFELE